MSKQRVMNRVEKRAKRKAKREQREERHRQEDKAARGTNWFTVRLFGLGASAKRFLRL